MNQFDPLSRYKYTTRATNLAETVSRTYLFAREPIAFEDDEENTTHVVRAGETLQTLATKYFGSYPDAATLWWVIAEFQPTPIVDPTQKLKPGALLVIPSPILTHNIINSRYEDTLA
jgi:nucleoid-associated protein YgaU